MISELGTVRDIAYLSGEEPPLEVEIPEVENETEAVPQVVIGSLIEQSSVYSSGPRRRFRVRSSSVI